MTNAVAGVLPATLLVISLVLALVLGLAWWEFGRPRHALSWTVAFALFAGVWAVRLADAAPVPAAMAGMPCLGIGAFAVNTLGFRQRAAMPERRGLLIAVAGCCALWMIVAVDRGAPPVAWLLPFAAGAAGLCLLAAGALGGRRRSERVVARIAHYA